MRAVEDLAGWRPDGRDDFLSSCLYHCSCMMRIHVLVRGYVCAIPLRPQLLQRHAAECSVQKAKLSLLPHYCSISYLCCSIALSSAINCLTCHSIDYWSGWHFVAPILRREILLYHMPSTTQRYRGDASSRILQQTKQRFRQRRHHQY